MASQKRRVFVILAITLVIAGFAALFVWYNLFREVDLQYDSVEEYFKYGSVGTEQEAGLPYWIWQALPRVFPEYLPGEGWSSLGFVYEDGKEVPIGMSEKTIGFRRLGINCAFCHVVTWRESPDDEANIVLAGAPQTFDVQGYERFLFACAEDDRFNAASLLPAIEEMTDLSLTDSLLHRLVLIPQTRKALLEQAERFSWMDDKPDWGPGRIDPFNDLKYHFAGLPRDETIGNSDMMPLWNMQPRQDAGSFHWDGLADDLGKILQNSAVGDGSVADTIPRAEMERLEKYFLELPPPPYPFAIDEELAATGSPIYAEHCASCHEIGQPEAGQIVLIDEIGTDRHRFDMWTEDTPPGYNRFVAEAFGWEPQVRKMPGYTAVFLDGLWLRGPYLHNGSVPNLREILEPPENRSPVFYRGYDVINTADVGFVTSGSDAERHGFRFDTSVPGNGNGGHLYGTDLPPESKEALLEYLKTL